MFATNMIINSLFSLFAAVFVVITTIAPEWAVWWLKSAPIWILIYWAGTTLKGATRVWALLGLLFSVTGDITLALSDDYFVAGLAAFLVAHLFYAFLFSRHIGFNVDRMPSFLLFIGMVIGICVLVLPQSGELFLPVFLYVFAICYMALMALMRNVAESHWVRWGAMSFLVSDSLIGLDKFVLAVPYDTTFIMATYYLAQWLIVYGLIRTQQASDGIGEGAQY